VSREADRLVVELREALVRPTDGLYGGFAVTIWAACAGVALWWWFGVKSDMPLAQESAAVAGILIASAVVGGVLGLVVAAPFGALFGRRLEARRRRLHGPPEVAKERIDERRGALLEAVMAATGATAARR
jgi:hypothetical protein